MKKIILILLIAYCLPLTAQSWWWVLTEGSDPYPKTDDLISSYFENKMLVSGWYDQTGIYNLLQATAEYQPLKLMDELDGYPALQFDGVDDILVSDEVVFGLGVDALTVYLIYKPLEWTNNDGIFGTSTGEINVFQGGGSPNIYAFRGFYNLSTGSILGSYQILTIVFNGSSSIIQTNDNTQSEADAGAANINLKRFSIGGLLTYFSKINVVALYIHSSGHNETTRSQIKDWLRKKYPSLP